jgi:hypothetical protein
LIATASNLLSHCGYDLELGGPSLASLVFVVVFDLLGHDPDVDHHLPFPPFWF